MVNQYWAYRVPTTYTIIDAPKQLRETLCVVMTGLTDQTHLDRLQRLVDECDRHRPLGTDGKHGNLHTYTCGCDDK
jgi:hypothetical protein